jgi:hypothetical protein
LTLPTSGIESPKKTNVLSSDVYNEPQKHFIHVLESAGVQFISQPDEQYNYRH